MKAFAVAGYFCMGETTLLGRFVPESRARDLTVSLIKPSHDDVAIDPTRSVGHQADCCICHVTGRCEMREPQKNRVLARISFRRQLPRKGRARSFSRQCRLAGPRSHESAAPRELPPGNRRVEPPVAMNRPIGDGRRDVAFGGHGVLDSVGPQGPCRSSDLENHALPVGDASKSRGPARVTVR